MKRLSLLLPLVLIRPLLGDELADLQKRLHELERHIATMEQDLEENKEDTQEGLEILEKVETKTILDKLNFSPSLELRFDKFYYKNNQIEGEDTKIPSLNYTGNAPAPGTLQRRDEFTKNYEIATTVYFDLYINARLNDFVKFHGKLSFAQTTQSYQRLCILSRDIKSQPSKSAFDTTLAYFDYTPHPNDPYATTFSFGVLPTANGTPMQYAQNIPRESMFPALVFDMNTYGLVLTQRLDRTYIRAIAAQAYTLRPVFYPYQCNRENIDNATVVGLYGDTTLNVADTKTLLSGGINALYDFKAHPYLGPDVNSALTSALGHIYTAGVGVDSENILMDGLTLFGHFAYSLPKGNKAVQDYQITHYQNGNGLTQDGTPGFSEAGYAKGEMLQHNGYAFFVGGHYRFGDSFSGGIEFNHGSKYWFGATQGAKSMYNKLATRGNAYEGYLILNYTKNLYAKIGYLQIDEHYTGSGWHFGEPAKKDASQHIGYLSLEAKF